MTKVKRGNGKYENIDIINKNSGYNPAATKIVRNNLKSNLSNNIKDKEVFYERTKVVYGEEKTTKLILKALNNSKNKWDNYTNSEGPTIAMGVTRIRKGMENAYERGIKIRYISEITKHNIHYCKELMMIAELRHLDDAKGGMAVNEVEYIATAHLQESKPVLHLIHSNVKEIVEQQQLVFESFWIRAVPAEQKIKEIEDGTELIKTKVLEYPSDIYNHLINTIKKSNGCYVCFSIGGMRMIYNTFFNSFKRIIQRQETEDMEPCGIKWLTYIDDNKNNVELVKAFLNAGIQIRHIKNLPSINYAVDNNNILATIERMDDGKLMNDLLVSNEPAYIKHFMSFFQEKWSNHGIDAVERIKNIEEGVEYDNEIIRHSDRAFNSYLDIIKTAQNEILFIFPTPKAFIRQLKAIDLAIQVSKERKAKVRILTPSNELVVESIKLLSKKEKEYKNHENPDHAIVSFSNNDIKIRFIEKMSNTKSTIVVVDKKESLVMELKDDTKDTFIQAIGLSTYSNSKPAVLSYIAIFENLWKQSELYYEIKESHEQLRMANGQLKIKDKILNEFIQIAAHEFRNPIQPILGLSQAIKFDLEQKYEYEINKDKVLNIMEVIIRNAKKLQQLSDDILDVGRIETSSLNLNKEIFDLKELLQGLVDDFKNQQSQQQKNNCDIKVLSIIETKQLLQQQQKSGLYLVKADKSRIIQVVSNILNNALKFTNNDCLIQIIIDKKYIHHDQNYILVSIKDSGSGIDNEIYPKLFTKFVSKSYQGTGLGLYISKNIIEAHGGKIRAENNKDSKGATFTFSLPSINDKNNNY